MMANLLSTIIKPSLITFTKTFVALSLFSENIGTLSLVLFLLFAIYQMHGPSMYPTINPQGDVGVVDTISIKHLSKQPERGDVVVFTSPQNRHRKVVKRVVGVAGDSVYRNRHEGDLMLVTVPKGHVWVEGDNADDSLDSRAYGLLLARVWIGGFEIMDRQASDSLHRIG